MSLFSLLSVSASGMSAQRARAELLVENLANAETTRTPEGGPYRRKDPRINPAEDMVDLISATRSYGANVAAISSVKDMIQRSIDLLR